MALKLIKILVNPTRVDSCREVACFLIFMTTDVARKANLPHMHSFQLASVTGYVCFTITREAISDDLSGRKGSVAIKAVVDVMFTQVCNETICVVV
jgi:hypothetical protein